MPLENYNGRYRVVIAEILVRLGDIPDGEMN
jgi:hypothetical protein